MVLALGIAHSTEAAQAQRQVNDVTNALLKKNAEKLHMASVETAKEAERGIVDIETLKKTNADLIQTLDDVMIVYARGVVRACHHCLVVCDMPFGSYQVSREEAVRNAVRIMKETGADALKLEGGAEIVDTIRAIIAAGIPVEGHLGLTPQSIHKLGGYGLRAKEEAEAAKLLADAHALDDAGCFAITLEKVPAKLAAQVTREVKAVTIGIGAGADTDGQVLVYADALGMTQGFKPKFLRHFADMATTMTAGVQAYVDAVKTGGFPSAEESY